MRTFLTAAFALVLIAGTVSAEVVIMKNGDRFEGMVKDDGDQVKVTTKYGELDLKRADIEAIVDSPEEVTAEADELRQRAEALADTALEAPSNEERNRRLDESITLLEDAREIYTKTRSYFPGREYNFLDEAVVAINQQMKIYRDRRVYDKEIPDRKPEPEPDVARDNDPEPDPVHAEEPDDEIGMDNESPVDGVAEDEAEDLGDGWKRGLLGEYFDGMEFDELISEHIDKNVSFYEFDDLGEERANGDEEFSVRWSGQIQVPATGQYTFTLTSDDGSRLKIGGKVVVDNWGDHGMEDKEGSVQLVKGEWVDVRVEYYENGGDAGIELRWNLPGREPEIVPSEAFRTKGSRRKVGEIGSAGELTFETAEEAIAILTISEDAGEIAAALDYLEKNPEKSTYTPLVDRYLEETDERLFKEYAEALIELNKKRAERDVREEIESGVWQTIKRYLEIIRRTKDRKAIDHIVTEVTQTGYAEDELEEILSALKSQHEYALKLLFELLSRAKDTEMKVRIIKAIGMMKDKDAAPGLVKLLGDTERAIRVAAANALRTIGEAAYPAVLQGLGAKDRRAQNNAGELLREWSKLEADNSEAKEFTGFWRREGEYFEDKYDEYWEEQEELEYPVDLDEFGGGEGDGWDAEDNEDWRDRWDEEEDPDNPDEGRGRGRGRGGRGGGRGGGRR